MGRDGLLQRLGRVGHKMAEKCENFLKVGVTVNVMGSQG